MVDQQIQMLLRQGIAAARARQNDQAYELLLQVVELDENNVQAWLWLSTVIDDLEDKIICLQNVLELDPSNQHAQVGLAKLTQQTGTRQTEPTLSSIEESTRENEVPVLHPQKSHRQNLLKKRKPVQGDISGCLHNHR